MVLFFTLTVNNSQTTHKIKIIKFDIWFCNIENDHTFLNNVISRQQEKAINFKDGQNILE